MSWLYNFIRTFQIPDLRKKILFVLGIFVLFRLMANIPMPGIDTARIEQFFANNQLFGLLNLFTGGALDSLSIVMLGLGPYITAVIIMQLLTMIVPALEKLYKEEGEAGRAKFNQYGRYLAVPFALLQGYGFLALLTQQQVIDRLSPEILITSLVTITAGTILLLWFGELITEKGIGNGVSLLIFAGIITGFPSSLRQLFLAYDPTRLPAYVAFFVMAIVIIAGVVYITEARRNIPVT